MSKAITISCSIYKTAKRDGLYLYVREADNFEDVPEPVMVQFPEPEHVFDLELTEKRHLALEDVLVVMKNLQQQGFHLQMPPGTNKDIIAKVDMPDSLNG